MMNYEDFDDDYEKDFYQEDDDVPTIPCSNCNQQVYEDAVRCPACGDYVTRKWSTWGEKPIWLRVLVLLIIGFLILGFAFAY